MDFFGSQDSRHRQSLLLIACFVAAMLALAVLVQAVAVVISLPKAGAPANFFEPSNPAKAFIVLIWLTCVMGCFFRTLDGRSGGPALARRFGAVKASQEGRYADEKQLVDLVHEMAVASSCTVPETYLLHRESSINAFVVGGFKGKEALVVSQGALDQLNREQLCAVIAHEFGHIASGDIPLNMRLLVALSGLNAIDEVGRLLMVRSHTGDLFAQPGLIVGFVLRCLGAVGVFFGRLLRSALSRQREYLADASAVQFTRNPEWVASALAAIRDEHDDEAIHGVHAEELMHLCLQSGEKDKWHERVFATHPPIQKRIDAIDPHYATKQRAKDRAVKKEKPNLYSVGNGARAVPLSSEATVSVGALSGTAEIMLVDSSACLAVLHALFVSDDAKKSKMYISAIAFAYNKLFAHQVEEIKETLSDDIRTNQLAIIETATEQIRENIKLDNRQRLLKSLEKLIMVEGEYTLINYATLQLIRRKLDADFPVLESVAGSGSEQTAAAKVKTFDTMGKEFALLLSLMVESSGSFPSENEKRFQDALKCYTKEQFPLRKRDEPGIVSELEASFQTLYVQPRPIREAFVQHCVELAQADGHIARDEKALLELFAASLHCDAIAA